MTSTLAPAIGRCTKSRTQPKTGTPIGMGCGSLAAVAGTGVGAVGEHAEKHPVNTQTMAAIRDITSPAF
jgi:hypothetical protein